MCLQLIKNTTVFKILLQIDRFLAEEARQGGCPACGGPLHWANYPRQPRGGPDGLGDEYRLRLSLCCGSEGCRKRLTPPSVRFLGRKVFFGTVIILFTALCHGGSPTRIEKLRDLLGVDRRTLARWREWWLNDFVASSFWKGYRGFLDSQPELTELPLSLLHCFTGKLKDQLVFFLYSLRPITSSSAPGNLAF